jgi:hypothetical protein
MLTIWCMVVIVASLFGMGIPLCWLLNGCRPLDEADRLKAPFFGIAALVLLLQNLLYFDLPLRRTTPWMWLLIVLLWVPIWWRGQLRACLPPLPRLVTVAVLLVALLQGLGLAMLGVREYVGRAWSDQFNYTSIAQFLMDERFSTSLDDVGQRPWMIPAVCLKADRIGQSVLHGFLACSCRSDAKTMFEPTILLMPPLVVLAIFSACRQLGLRRSTAALTGILAGLLPSLALTHLESFLSQSLAGPFLLLYPVLLHDLTERPGVGRLAGAVLCVAAAVSIYTEFLMLFAGLTVLQLGVAAVGSPCRGRLLLFLVLLLASPAALNPCFAPSILTVLSRVSAPVLQEVYPWALTFEGLARIWLGDLAAASPRLSALTAGYAICLTALCYVGLLRSCIGHWRAPMADRAAHWRSLALRLALLSLPMLPVIVILKDRDHPYQFYKLALTVSPILAIGLIEAIRSSPPSQGLVGGRFVPLVMRIGWATSVMLVVITLAGVGTAAMAYQATRLEVHVRTGAYLLRSPMLTFLKRLEDICDDRLLLCSEDEHYNPWLAYYARHNSVWLRTPKINDVVNLDRKRSTVGIADLQRLPEDLIILGSAMPWFSPPPMSAASIEWSDGCYILWRTRTREWALPAYTELPNGLERVGGRPLFWLGDKPIKIVMVCGTAGTLTLDADYQLAPSEPGSDPRFVRVRRVHGGEEHEHRLSTRGGRERLELPVVVGENTLILEPIADSKAQSQRIGVRDLRMTFTAGAPRGPASASPAQ